MSTALVPITDPSRLLPAPLPPLRKHTQAYLDYKAIRTTEATQRGYRSVLGQFEKAFPMHTLEMFEPPAGGLTIEDFLTEKWARKAARTYNKGLSVLSDFFKWHVSRGNLTRNPTDNIEKAKG